MLSGHKNPRLLPEALEETLRGWTVRWVGCALVVFAVTSWLALLSWQLNDPSAAQGAARASRNLLGVYGAVTSDFMVQMFGLAVVFALICPMVWGLELLSGAQRLEDLRGKAIVFPIALLVLAGFASCLPTVPSWPLHSGGGGMLGDIMYTLAMTGVSAVGMDKSNLLVGALLAVLGVVAMFQSLGLRLSHMVYLAPGTCWTVAHDTTHWWDFVPATLKRAPRPSHAVPEIVIEQSQPATAAAQSVAPAADTAISDEPAEAGEELDDLGEPVAAKRVEPHWTPAAVVADQAVTGASEIDPGFGDSALDAWDDDGFDEEMDVTARAVAERFAPKSGRRPLPEPAQSSARLLPSLKATLERARVGGVYRRPSLSMLRRAPAHGSSGPGLAERSVEDTSRRLESVLADFGVHGQILSAMRGPVATRYELEPQRGTKVSRVIGLADDFARSMCARSVRVAVAPGRSTIGIEVPNEVRQPVHLREQLESDAFGASQAQLPVALGVDLAGAPVVVDLAGMPHLLVAGTTGSGKSVGINAMILSLLYRHTPEDCRLLLIDPKMLELASYNSIPHLLTPVVTDAQQAAAALEWAVGEMEERYKLMAKVGVRNIQSFNGKVRAAAGSGRGIVRTVQTGFDPVSGEALYEQQRIDCEPMPFIVVVVDEFADLMIVAGKRVEAAVQRLAQKARAAGIHLVMATQRPSVDIVTGTIKANMPVRVSFRVASRIDSRTILNEHGAELLLGQGDMLVSSGAGQVRRVHGAYVGEDEVERVCEALRAQGQPRYVAALMAGPSSEVSVSGGRGRSGGSTAHAGMQEQTYQAAVEAVIGDRKASVGHLRRRLGIDDALAAAALQRMEREGVVGPANRIGRRTILSPALDYPVPQVA